MKTQTEPKIRIAKAGDEQGIHEAHMRSIREVCVKDHGEEEIKGWGNRPLGNRWDAPIKDGHIWIVEADDKIKGYAYIGISSKDGEIKAHIYGLYLTPEVLNMGFGKKLMDLMLDKAHESGAKIITLDSSITAHDFYKKFGFADSGPMRRSDIGGYPVTCFPMNCLTE